jgi:hypothetical protein
MGPAISYTVQIDEDDLLDLGLGRSIYSKAQVKEFLKFQDSQGNSQAYLMDIADLAYGGRGKDGSWGLGMGEKARADLINAMGWSLAPQYRWVGPFAVIMDCQSRHKDDRRLATSNPALLLTEIERRNHLSHLISLGWKLRTRKTQCLKLSRGAVIFYIISCSVVQLSIVVYYFAVA